MRAKPVSFFLLMFLVLGPAVGPVSEGQAVRSSIAANGPVSTVQPVILGMTREAVMPGKTPALVRDRAEAIQQMQNIQGFPISIALSSISGKEEVLYLHFYDSMGAIEDSQKLIASVPGQQAMLDQLNQHEGDMLTEKRDLTLLRMGDLSYRPDVDWAQTQYLDLITIHVRPGHHLEYLELRKMALAGHVRGGVDTNLILFKTTSGSPSPLYFILRPMKSLHTHDALRAKGFGEPLTDEENARMTKLLGTAVESEEEEFYRVEPSISHVTPEWSASNAAFWNGTRP